MRSPERARLTATLRSLKEHAGLSLTGLGEHTSFSKSSWGRYLKGETLPPREAVRELCRLAGEPEGRCLALWELAESESSGRTARVPPPARPETAPEPEAEPAKEPAEGPAPGDPAPPRPTPPTATATAHRRSWRVTVVMVAVLAVTAGGVTAAALLLPPDRTPDDSRGPATTTTGAGTGATTGPGTGPPSPRCQGGACEGRDPLNMLCGIGLDTLIERRTASGARLQVRYSATCGTSWGRIWNTRVGDRVELTAAGSTRSAEITDALDATAYIYTPMTRTAPGTLVRACFRPAGQTRREECFEATVR
ncbi:helix-turn-helix domain-containing protein [Streptomyces prasinus]